MHFLRLILISWTLLIVFPVNCLAKIPAFEEGAIALHTASGVHRLKVQFAETQEQQEFGLMKREAIKPYDGMLFIFPTPHLTNMWMKDTFIPLDILFIGNTGRIVHIATDAKPMSEEIIATPVPVKGVLEMQAGSVKTYRIHLGDAIDHPAFIP